MPLLPILRSSSANPAFKVTYPEWRTIMDALRHYKQHLEANMGGIEDEDAQLLVHDDLERLDLIILSLEDQFSKYTEQTALTTEQWESALHA